MPPLEQETNIEVLRSYAILATREVERLQKELAATRQQHTEQGFLSDDLKNQLVKLQEKFFGFGREKIETRPATHHKDQQLLLHGTRQGEQGPETESPGQQGALPDLPKTSFYELRLSELEREALSRGFEMSEAKDWKEINGLTQDSVEITVIERTYEKIVHKQKKYRFMPSVGTDKEIIVTAPGPVKVNPGCQYSVDFALAVVSDKYEYHTPLERQRRKMEAVGLDTSVKTLYGLCEAVADHANSVLPLIKEDIFGDKKVAVQLDETPWLIIGEESKSYMWVMSNRSATYFQFEPTRSGKIAAEMLGNFTGAILSDGFSGYNRFKKDEDLIVGNCWAHARREFYDIRKDYPEETAIVVNVMDELFDIERRAKTWDELKDLRKRESTEVLGRLRSLFLELRPKFFPGSGFVKAIDYCLGRWKELTAFTNTLPLPLTNNDPERALRHVVLGRKNFAGSKTINGADVAATLYTVIESCKKASLQPKEYLKYVVTERWHKRQPLSPLQYSWMTRGKPKRAGQ
jgi:transposase